MSRYKTWASMLVALVVGCYPIQQYACRDDSNCVDGVKIGVCEASRFCSYPDASCEESQRRYDDLAGGGLAGTCVVSGAGTAAETTGAGTTTAAPSSEGGASGTSSGESGTAESAESNESTDGPGCVDVDGDGFGVGGGCLGDDCDDDNPATAEDCFYIAPDGDDSAQGDATAPWRTFARAIPELFPGSSLVLMPGTYTVDEHGPLAVDCAAGPGVNGTEEAPILVRAAVERAAHVQTDGSTSGISLRDCAHWQIQGVRVSGADSSDVPETPVVRIDRGTEVTMRRMLVHTSNRYGGSPLYLIDDSDRTLLEECEAYDYGTAAYWSTGSTATTLRRVYSHSRSRADLPGCLPTPAAGEPRCSVDPDRGDFGARAGEAFTVENSIFENTALGVVGGADSDCAVLGSAFIGVQHGVVFGGDQAEGITTGLRVSDVVGVNVSSRVVYLRTVDDASLSNLTAVQSEGVLRTDLFGGTECPARGGCRSVSTNLLAVGSLGDGITNFDDNMGVVRHSNVFGSLGVDYLPTDDPIEDRAGYYQQSMSIAVPRIGPGSAQCIAYVPDDSVMAGAGEDGEDIGANILFRVVDRQTTTERLWDAETGSFPCGAVIAGVNDTEATSCVGAHARLHVATDGCPLP